PFTRFMISLITPGRPRRPGQKTFLAPKSMISRPNRSKKTIQLTTRRHPIMLPLV
ncbi:hypothetical protein FRC07_009164, partial [Ceratobasidium sp. 392]